MIESGKPLPQLRCFVPGDRAVHLGEVAPGDHLVIYTAGAGVAPASLDAAVRWPLPTRPRTSFLVVDHESTFQGFIRTHTIEDVAFVVRRAIDPPEGIIRAVIGGPDREVNAIIDDVNVVALRSRVSLALQLSRTASKRRALLRGAGVGGPSEEAESVGDDDEAGAHVGEHRNP